MRVPCPSVSVIGLLAGLALATPVFAQLKYGAIKVGYVGGFVTRVDANGASAPLHLDAIITETDTVVTGSDSEVVLVFSSGSTVKVGALSRLGISTYRMNPLPQAVPAKPALTPPPESKSVLHLSYGEIVGDVRAASASSSWVVLTPLGSIALRNSPFLFALAVSTTATTGKVSLTVNTLQGRGVFSAAAGPGRVAPSDLKLEAGKELVVTAPEDSRGAELKSDPVLADLPLPALHAGTAVITSLVSIANSTVITVTERLQAAARTK